KLEFRSNQRRLCLRELRFERFNLRWATPLAQVLQRRQELREPPLRLVPHRVLRRRFESKKLRPLLHLIAPPHRQRLQFSRIRGGDIHELPFDVSLKAIRVALLTSGAADYERHRREQESPQ